MGTYKSRVGMVTALGHLPVSTRGHPDLEGSLLFLNHGGEVVCDKATFILGIVPDLAPIH